jgi:alkyl sulfatase BDS1-like metallo-beta-lactamase superfamily hydrolase
MTSNTDSSTAGLKVAELVKSGETQASAIQRAPGIYEVRGVGNSYLLATADGDILVNAGTLADARRGRELFLQVSQRPIRYIILTQSHGNQYGGLEIYKTADNQVIAHRNYVEERRCGQALNAHYRRGSRRIFSSITGATGNLVPTREVPPDLLIAGDHVLELGGRRIEILWTPGGETRSSVIVWLPHEKIVLAGNLFGPLFGNQPNLNTLRGDKPRSALEFIASVKRLRDLRPELLLTGHEAIGGADRIERDTTRIIDSVQWIHDRTVEGMNAGLDIRTLMREIKPPAELALTEEYGKVAWNVRAIWHEYTGWFDPSRGLTELYDVPATSIANALAKLSGGVGRLVEQAAEFVRTGEPLQALHMLDIAFAVDSENAGAREVKRQALNVLLENGARINLWERMSIAAELRELSE